VGVRLVVAKGRHGGGCRRVEAGLDLFERYIEQIALINFLDGIQSEKRCAHESKRNSDFFSCEAGLSNSIYKYILARVKTINIKYLK